MRPNEADRTRRVVVVGGGLAGLATAAYLGRAGLQVTLFESGRLGGRAVTDEVDGYLFNTGPHALYDDQAVEVLRDLGVTWSGNRPVQKGAVGLVGNAVHPLPRDVVSLATSSLLSVPARLEAAQWMTRIGRVDPSEVRHLTVRAWLDQEVRCPEMRRLLQALMRLSTFCNDPERQSAGAAIEQFQLGGRGVYYLDGGWQTLVDGLVGAAKAAGVEILANSRVKQVVFGGEGSEMGVEGVRLEDGAVIPAETVVLAVRPQVAAAATDLPVLREWAVEAIPARVASLEVALDRLPNPACPFALGIDRPLYLSVHSLSARLAPSGGAMVHVARYLGSEPAEDPRQVEAELERVLDQVQPGWKEHVATRRFLPNMVAVTAIDRADRGGKPGRPGPAVPGVAGLFVAGDWVGPEGMLADAALASARSAARMVVETATRGEPDRPYALA